MANEPFKPELRLVFQGSITLGSAEEAETIYKELKVWIRMWGENQTLNGQIIKMLEPCCQKPASTTGILPVSKQKEV